jgi:hypothetical protein
LFGYRLVAERNVIALSQLLEDAEAHCAAIEATGGHRGDVWGRYVRLRVAMVEAQRQVKGWLGLEQPFGRGGGMKMPELINDGLVDFPGLGRHRL